MLFEGYGLTELDCEKWVKEKYKFLNIARFGAKPHLLGLWSNNVLGLLFMQARLSRTSREY